MSQRTTTHDPRPVDSMSRADLYMYQLARLHQMRAALIAQLEATIAKIRESYRARLERLERAISAREDALRTWAEANPSMFDGNRSLQLKHGRIGWRLGNPSLRLLGGCTWESVLDRLERRGLTEYIRIEKEPDKRKILADAEQLPLRELGLRIYQRDEFYATPHADPTREAL
jgi:phage host-nuclease inhibitor protein Gam